MVSLPELGQNGAHGLFGLLTERSGLVLTHVALGSRDAQGSPGMAGGADVCVTCLILVPVIEPLTSITNMTSLGTTGSPRGAK